MNYKMHNKSSAPWMANLAHSFLAHRTGF